MSEYMNPFAGSMLPETVPNNSFASGSNQGDNQRMMAPFMQMEQQRQQMGIEQLQQSRKEAMTPEAQQLRQQQIKQKLVTSQREEREATDWLAEAPEVAKLRVLKLKQAMSAEQGAPAQAAYKFFATAAQGLENIPENARSLKYDDYLKQFQDANPGVELPENLKTYSPKLYGQLQEIRKASIMTDDHIRKLAEEAQKSAAHNAGTLAVAQEQRRGSMAETQVREAGANARHAGTLAQGKMTGPQEIVRLRRVINNPNSTPEEMEMAEASLESAVTQSYDPSKHPGSLQGNAMAIRAMGKPPDHPDVLALKQHEHEMKQDYLVDQSVKIKVKDVEGKHGKKGAIYYLKRSQQKEAERQGFQIVK